MTALLSTPLLCALLAASRALAGEAESLKAASEMQDPGARAWTQDAPLRWTPSPKPPSPHPNDLQYPKELMLQEIAAKAAERTGQGKPQPSVLAQRDFQNRVLLAFLDTQVHAARWDADLDVLDALWALGEVGDERAVALLERLRGRAGRVARVNAAVALNKLTGQALPESLSRELTPGDIVFRKGYFGLLNPLIGVMPIGHVGVVSGTGAGEARVVEGWMPVKEVSWSHFIKHWPYYGNRVTAPPPDAGQRARIVDFARAQLGKPYSLSHIEQKGPSRFDCVGLAEAAYENAGLNPTPDDQEVGRGWPLTPAEQYDSTVPVP